MRISSIPKVQVTVWKVYENNILHYLRSSRYSDYWYDEDGEYASTGSFVYNTYEIGSYADKVYDRQVETRDLARKGSLNLLNLSFDDLGVHKGIYLVSIASTDDRWINATKLVALSDVGMIVKHPTTSWSYSRIRSVQPIRCTVPGHPDVVEQPGWWVRPGLIATVSRAFPICVTSSALCPGHGNGSTRR